MRQVSAPPTRDLFEKTIEHNVAECIVTAGLDMLSLDNIFETSELDSYQIAERLYDTSMTHENYGKIISRDNVKHDAEVLGLGERELKEMGRMIACKLEKACGNYADWVKKSADEKTTYKYVSEQKFRANDKGIDDKHGIAAKPDFVVVEDRKGSKLVYPIEVRTGDSRELYNGEMLQLTAELICVGRNYSKINELAGDNNWTLYMRPKVFFTDGSIMEVDLSDRKYMDDVWRISRQIRNIEEEFEKGILKPTYRCSSCSLATLVINGKPACDKKK
ncbi:MAG: hypothetical protein KQA33_03095 [Candidatus Aenigmarchaeota archaeon]|nr:hypothetical protein [Candidatus Aenigmarchaeota archaeon]